MIWADIARVADFSVSGWLDARSRRIAERKPVLGCMGPGRRQCMFILGRRVEHIRLLIYRCEEVEDSCWTDTEFRGRAIALEIGI